MLPIHFAPLQGYTEAPYRRIHNEICGGISAYYTPFIRLEHGQIRKKDLREALPEQNEGINIIPQVIASDVSEFTPLAKRLIDLGHRHINVNMGCPFPLQTRLGRGSGLLPHTDSAIGILEAIQRLHEESQTEFSIKMRLGQESPEEAMTLLPHLNQTPLLNITMHPRVGRAQYKGELDMESFDRFYEGCQAPLIFNGLLTTPEEIHAIEERYPRLAGAMIGRGLLSRPTLASEYMQQQEMDPTEIRRLCLEMHRRLFAHYEQAIEGGESQLVQKMHSFWEYLEPLFSHKAVKKILKSGNLRNYREAVANCQ